MKKLFKFVLFTLTVSVVIFTEVRLAHLSVSATDAAPGTILFRDNFNAAGYDLATSGWELTGAADSWSIKADPTTTDNMELNQNNGNTEAFALNGDISWDNYTFQANVKENNNGYPGLLARYTDSLNYYYFRFAGTSSVELQKQVNGTWTSLGSANFTVVQGKWYTFKFVLRGQELLCYINDQLIIQATDDSLTHGKIGFRTKWGDDSFDNVIVTQAASLPPAPTGLKVDSVTDSSAQLSWDATTGATTYTLWRAASTDGSFSTVCTTSNLQCTDSNLESGQQYFYKLTYTNGVDISAPSAQVQTTTEIKMDSLTAQPFLTSIYSKEVTSVKLHWEQVPVAAEYALYRSTSEDGNYTQIYRGTSLEYDDYGLAINSTYYYKVEAFKDGVTSELSDPLKVNTFTVSDNVSVYNNTMANPGTGRIYPTFKAGDTYYNYQYVTLAGSSQFKEIEVATSTDGINWSTYKDVLDQNSDPALKDCKFEGVTFTYFAPTQQMVGWVHYENSENYNLGDLASFSGTPGEQLTFNGAFHPMGHDSRDMTYYVDPDTGKGYIVSAGDTNSDMYIYQVDDATHTKVVSQVAEIFIGQHREAPSVIKKDGYYYIFTSTANGWYPSQGMYASAKSMAGPWSPLRPIGDTTTFSSQSGWISGSADTTYVMNGSRWTFGWASGAASTGSRELPISFNDNGYANYDYYDQIVTDNNTGMVIPVQVGQNISEGKTATASGSLAGHEPSAANDGNYFTNWSYTGAYDWPQWWMVDLGGIYNLNSIQISWYDCDGSDGYFTYKIETSMDGVNFTTAYNGIYNKDYGFTSNQLTGQARYVRVDLLNASLQNNPTNNWYIPQLYEVKVLGESVTQVAIGAGAAVSLPNTNTTVQSASDLPAGTYIYFKNADTGDTTAQKLASIGDALTFFSGLPATSYFYTGNYQLTMAYDESKYAADQVGIYQYNDQTAQWTKLDGTVANGKVTVSVPVKVGATYGLFAQIPDTPVTTTTTTVSTTAATTGNHQSNESNSAVYYVISGAAVILIGAGVFSVFRKK